jgi:hypothetical protein
MKLVNCGITACGMRFLRKARAMSTIPGQAISSMAIADPAARKQDLD